jgi:hypothetical protein
MQPTDTRSRLGAALILTSVLWASSALAAPPPQGPPPASVDGDSFPFTVIRAILETEGDQVIASNNQSSPHKLSWASGARPTQCGHACFGQPAMTATRHRDRPNENIARVFARLVFDLDINNSPFNRRIITNVTVNGFCEGWREGNGNIRFRVKVDPPFVDEPGLLESIADFVALPLNLSRRIEDGIRAQLGSGGSTTQDLPARCRSLGVFAVGNPASDAVVWDPPLPPLRFPAAELALEQASVRFESIQRLQTLSSVDPARDITFDFYVNGRLLPVPLSGELTLAPSATHTLQEVAITLPADGMESLQIIVADSLGGANFEHFERNSGFPSGRRALRTVRTELVPVGGIGGLPGSNKPTPIIIQDFQVNYTVRVGERVLAQPEADGGGGGRLTGALPTGPAATHLAPLR